MKVYCTFNCATTERANIIDLIHKKKMVDLLKYYEWDYYTKKQGRMPAGSFEFSEKGVSTSGATSFSQDVDNVDEEFFKQLVANSVDVY